VLREFLSEAEELGGEAGEELLMDRLEKWRNPRDWSGATGQPQAARRVAMAIASKSPLIVPDRRRKKDSSEMTHPFHGFHGEREFAG